MWWMLVLYQIIAYSSFFLSMTLNFYLMFLIHKHTGSAMKPYAKILLQSVFTDLAMSISVTFLQMEMESYQSTLFGRGSPIWFSSTNPLKCSAIPFGGMLAILCYWSTPLQAVFRYFLVCRRKVLPIYVTIAMQSLVISIGFAACFALYLTFEPINEAPEKLRLLKSLPVWKYELGVEENFCYANIQGPILAIACIVTVVLINFGFFVLLLTSWRIYVFLKASEAHMSAKTKELHVAFNKKILYQTLLPAFAAVLIIVIIGLAYFTKSFHSGIFIYLCVPYYMISFINPLITICCVRGYRITTTSILYRRKIPPSSECIAITKRNTLV
uniref:G_PROTEIN_RECEP_F1_2 domain-containing protein n=1 Tax=Panagrellus redivivus TaxID=6233 RepID=A0A7E4WA77_PANRE